ncbi:hypothetical protein AJ78_06278 [Emergomyces pasteurianus Ep9510]|uniref:Tachykinin family protein n=1 Tax=Emergomyces pasteurianus Ep9510 TaxID=1447872 RepID=A0A1J9P9U3_9EURO|nr:hypothetical protein AJ78_06278 [Emergomyces pasteurianus Ep9510]
MANHLPWEQAGRILTPQHNFRHDFEHQHQQQQQLHLQLQLQPQQQHQHLQIQTKGRTTVPKALAKPAQASKSSKASPPLDVPSFTFIDHDDDLASKRIKDTKARKAIRSHVMRDVRRRERLAGLKRTSKRGAAKEKPLSPAAGKHNANTETTATKNRRKSAASASEEDTKQNVDNDSVSGRTTMSASPISSSELSMISRSPSGGATSATSVMQGQDGSYSSPFPSPLADSTAWAFDPFGTLPGSNPSTHTVIDGLIKYFSSVLIPMTFPAESKQPQDSKNRMGLIISATISEAGPFFGYMSLCAAHRAILQGKHSDLLSTSGGKDRVLYEPDYYMMKARCIGEMNKKMQDPALALTDSAFDIVVSLTSCALTIGDFDEARMHIQGLKKMVDMRGGVTGPSFQGEGVRLLSNLLTCDIMAASGLMTRPFFPLTWDPQPIPPETAEHILPPPTSPLCSTGMALCTNEALSSPLRKALMGLREILFFEHSSAQDSTNFSAVENEIFLFKSHEMEHELLEYPYRLTQTAASEITATTTTTEDPFHPLETVARTAAICHISNFFVVSPPSSGLGRALIHHLTLALSRFPTSAFAGLPSSWLDLLAWAAFLGARGSKGQKTKPWFLQRLRDIGQVRGWIGASGSGSGSASASASVSGWGWDDGEYHYDDDGWKEVEEVLKGYLYISDLQSGTFRAIWEEVLEGPVVMEVGEG